MEHGESKAFMEHGESKAFTIHGLTCFNRIHHKHI